MSSPVLRRITIYPVKSLDGIDLQNAVIGEGGCLQHDRKYMMTDENGIRITGKTNALVHRLRSSIDLEKEIISLRSMDETSWTDFHLQKEKDALESYLSAYFGKKVLWLQNSSGRFLDIPDISGATILSTASLQETGSWFDGMGLEETRKRFRATLEIDGVPAFWEDHLFGKEGSGIEFTAGNVKMIGISPRARCVVPTRHPETGEVIHAFPKSFARHRAATLPGWSELNEFGHYYYLTVNCLIPATETGKTICTGDRLKIIGIPGIS
ncbi:MAG: MOSC N-terminal beta barrel domain-containing protein [Chitinophagaceae bacterium]